MKDSCISGTEMIREKIQKVAEYRPFSAMKIMISTRFIRLSQSDGNIQFSNFKNDRLGVSEE